MYTGQNVKTICSSMHAGDIPPEFEGKQQFMYDRIIRIVVTMLVFTAPQSQL